MSWRLASTWLVFSSCSETWHVLLELGENISFGATSGCSIFFFGVEGGAY